MFQIMVTALDSAVAPPVNMGAFPSFHMSGWQHIKRCWPNTYAHGIPAADLGRSSDHPEDAYPLPAENSGQQNRTFHAYKPGNPNGSKRWEVFVLTRSP